MCGSQTLEEEAVKLRKTWRPYDVKDARAMEYLTKKVAKRQWNQPRRKMFVVANKHEKGVHI